MVFKLGIWQVHSENIIPGTFPLAVEIQPEGPTHIVKVPAPSNDPEDPLNWSKWQKWTILWTIAIASALVHTLGPMVNTSYNQLSREFGQDRDAITQAVSGEFSLMLGIGTVTTTAFAVTYGKRPAFLLSTLLLVGSTVLVYFARNFTVLGVARAIEGFASAPFEVVAHGIIADVFFVHERGLAIAIISAWSLLAILLGQVGGGFVVQYLGWRKLFLVGSIVSAIVLPALFFLVPETVYRRVDAHIEKAAALSEVSTASQDTVSVKNRAVNPLRVWRGRLGADPYWAALLRPLGLLIHPSVIFGIIVHGLGSTYLHAFAFAKLQLLSQAPYNLTPSQIGMTTLAGAVAGTIANPLAGYMSDALAKNLSKRSGIYEAEYRLILMIPYMIFSTIGFVGFGISVQHGQPLWVVLGYYSAVAFSIPFGGLAALTYLLDSMQERNQEAMVGIVLIKNVFILIFASFINGWIESSGPGVVFATLGGLNLGISLMTVPFYLYGKSLRMYASGMTLRKLFTKNSPSREL